MCGFRETRLGVNGKAKSNVFLGKTLRPKIAPSGAVSPLAIPLRVVWEPIGV